tara:strand:+ start:1247 stop:2212 length:966 start_codon:yes stop_codon:yes gene_type:complete
LVKGTNEKPLVSIIINCFNGDKYLKEAINSIYNQSYHNWEIIFWDNQSTDESANIAKSFDQKLKYFYASNHTPLGEARNEAVKVTNGDFIAFLDCDDLWLPEKLDLQIKKITSGDYSMCYGGCIEIDKDENKIRSRIPQNKDGNMFESLLFQWDVCMQAILVRKKDLLKYKLNFDKNIYASAEYNLFMRLAVKTQFCSVKELIVKWRIREDSLTSQQISKWAYERRYTLDKIIRENSGIEKKYRQGFEEAFARSFYYDARYYMFKGQRKNARKALKKVKNVNYKYFILYLTTFLPSFVWNLINSDKVKRKYLLPFFNFFKN